MSVSNNGVLNGVLALIRSDLANARSQFHAMDLPDWNVSEVSAKIFEELERLRAEIVISELTEVLKKSMTLQKNDKEEDFEDGVIAVEQIINNIIMSWKPFLGDSQKQAIR